MSRGPRGPRRLLGGVVALLVATASSLPGGGARARQIPVHPSPEDSSQGLGAALAVAVRGDSLMLRPGLYRGTFTLKSGVSIVGVAGPDSTVLDADGDRYVLYGREVDSTTVVTGLTIQNGRRDHPNSGGGGIYLHRSSPVIVNNVFRGHLGYLGPGVYTNYFCRPIVAFNVFRGNEGYLGGAIAAYQDCGPLVFNNFIHDNRSVSGGGILCMNSAPVIVSNTIVGNHANQGGIYCDSSPALIEANVIAHNSKGGAIYSLDQDEPATIRGNLVWENAGGSVGGARSPFVGLDGNCEADPRFADLEGRRLARASTSDPSPADCLPRAGAQAWDPLAPPAIPDSILALWRDWTRAHESP